MRKLTMVLVVALAVLWGTAAFAYSALDDEPGSGTSVGLGGIALSGNDGAGNSGSQFLPTISITGMTDYVVWQAFYGFGDATAFGGSVDYILADNFDECATCDQANNWWFGAGASLISYSDLFVDDTGANGISDTELGVNLGAGVRWDQWGFDVYAHYFPSNQILGLQGQLLYNFD